MTKHRIGAWLAALAGMVLLAGAAPTPAVAGTPPSPLAGTQPSAPAVGGAPLACPLGLSPSAPVSPAGGRPFSVCTGYVKSFDGTPLHVDVSIPLGHQHARPLMVMLHGWGSNKSDFEATSLSGNSNPFTYHWNNAWFASQGYAVLNYTARGFGRSCGKVNGAPYYLTEPGCAGRASWTHLADRRYEIRDTQYLSGLLVDAHVALPNKIAVTGDSYGGGQSWMLALSQDQVMHRNGSLSPWRSPEGVPLHLAAAIPLFPWTDLLQALVDNGRASDGFFGAPPNGSRTSPVGVEKLSYVQALFSLGLETAQFAPPPGTPGSSAGGAPGAASANLTGWDAAITAGEPYSANPLVAQAVHQLTKYRSAFYMPVPPPSKAVPVFDVQGLTDPLFPGIQALQLDNRLFAKDPSYPVTTYMGDVGHPYAQNPPSLWRSILQQANTWLASVMEAPARAPTGHVDGGAGPTSHGEGASTHGHAGGGGYTVATILCVPGQTRQTYTSHRFPGLVHKVLQLSSTASFTLTNSPAAGGTEGEQTDPILSTAPGQPGCRSVPVATYPDVASFTFAPGAATLIGSPVVHTRVTLAQGSNAEIAARLFDVNPAAGTKTLITRSVYRLTGSAGQTQALAFELWPTAWQLLPGHQVQLELTQVDSPTWRPDNLPSTLQVHGVTLTLPVH
ncbi:MAG: CocE/NonD family hydrolase [Acidimicrobiales bacterium]